ncbi:hypothetical protein Tco_1402533 [Tanacetum coccineum]
MKQGSGRGAVDSIVSGRDSRGSYHMTYKRDYLFDFEEYDGGNVLLEVMLEECRDGGLEVRREQGYKGFAGGTIRKKKANCVYTLDGQAMTRKTIRKGVYTTMYGVAKHLGVAGIHSINGCFKETKRLTLFSTQPETTGLVACEVISKRHARIKDDTGCLGSHVYVHS